MGEADGGVVVESDDVETGSPGHIRRVRRWTCGWVVDEAFNKGAFDVVDVFEVEEECHC